MESLKPLYNFFTAIENDFRVSPTHIAIFAALLQFRNSNGFANPIEAYRYEITPVAKVLSAYTYHKCIRELSEYGYLKYEPSSKKTFRSKIYFFD
ncbi:MULTISPECIES: hypothetical protein [Flavobacterium]|uniref:hypothetical protein n=1 Tax=Flavobacterium TaxID=237 RepID=UPI00091BC8B2|nr:MULTISPECIES: hypothetical protein [Flavobacterium]MBJ2124300.1 hypothetical protein [Flavobacterium sp. IB48]OXA74230.1 hypothetical protein B0A67_00125 [Flavobacterium aquidurense]SHF89931.1 hypothetical protein SAMN05444481_10125 [Flavobacterium frigidimaris]